MPLSVSRLVHSGDNVIKKIRNKSPKHPWFKCKGCLHFDFALERAAAEKYVTDPKNIVRHRFSPLIHYTKISRKIQRDRKAEQVYKLAGKVGNKPALIVKEKPRNIFYTSHADGYIYSYYAHILQQAYVRFLSANNLADNVTAYRSIAKNGIKFCNSHFANEAFGFVRVTSGCHILCYDISKFFDNLSVAVLKEKLAQILNERRLPDDHYKVFESLVNFHYVEEGQLIENFKGKFAKNPRQHGLIKESGGSKKNRICDYPSLRNLEKKYKDRGRGLIKNKDTLDITGIPQGTAISGLLANIFMIDFDIAVKSYIEGNGGMYRRYSDDIFIAVPPTVEFGEVDDFIKSQLKKCCAESIQLNDNKTEKRIYQAKPGKNGLILDQNRQPAKAQYLGFHFDGHNVFIRNSSMSKDRGKIIQLIRKHKKRRGKIDTAKVFKQRSARIITPYDNKNAKGFIRYVEGAAGVHDNSATIVAQIKKDDRFIKRAIRRERVRKSGRNQAAAV